MKPLRLSGWRCRVITLAVLVIIGFAADARADLILDQAYDPGNPPPGSFALFPTRDLAQTFRVGLTGTLGRVDVDLVIGSGISHLTFEIRSTTAGQPNGSSAGLLASGSLAVTGTSGQFQFLELDLSTGVPVTTAEVLAIVLHTPDGQDGWAGDKRDPYPAGQSFLRDSGGGFVTNGDFDFGFKTFVDTAPVPEPSSLALLAVGALCCAGARRMARSWLRSGDSVSVK
jgi:hypothetical protein